MSKKKTSTTRAGKRIEVRPATPEDVPAICALSEAAYAGTGSQGYGEGAIRGQINAFPAGQIVVTVDGEIRGYCATFRVDGELALRPHTWDEITGGGFASRHDEDGDWLYGMEVFVHPDTRGYRIGQRLYNARKELCRSLGLKGIVFAGRIPTWRRRRRKYDSIEDYVEAIVRRRANDPVLTFQLRNGFEVIGIIPRYLDSDVESGGYGVHLRWDNPKVDPTRQPARRTYGGRMPDSIRIGTVQYMQRRITSFEQFADIVEYFVDVVADYKGDFAVFPELFTLQLLSMEDQTLSHTESIAALDKYTEPFKAALRDLAVRYNINIVGGSHPTRTAEGRIENHSYVFLRDGQVHVQPKIHPTPNEAHWWGIQGGDYLRTIDTDCGPIGILVCYDSEFPELARYLTDQGMRILFVPFCTDERQSYLRVRYCCQARAVENQIYVVLSGNVGNLPNVANMDIQYAESCILTPCDFPFARDGIAADTTPNTEGVAIADLRPDVLTMARQSGTVQNLKDRRHDLYGVRWRPGVPSR